ncbi:phototropic-responsive NPH3 family protein [Carex rostrata]
MKDLCDLKVNINGEHTFYLHQRIVCNYSGRLKMLIKQEKRRALPENQGLQISGFPGGAEAFELISRFCYNNGRIPIAPSNISLLYCCALILEMTEEVSPCNLLTQTEYLMDGLCYWSWSDILASLKNCEQCFLLAESAGLVDRFISALFTKISANSEIPLLQLQTSSVTPLPSSSSSSSSPDTVGFRCSSSKTPDSMKPCSNGEWWFDELTILAPPVIEKVMHLLGCYGSDNRNLLLTRFLLHYLRAAMQRPCFEYKTEYAGLADTAVHGVVLMGRTAFSCRGLFWVLRVVSNFGLSRECRYKLERLMGLALDQATLDDLLVSGGTEGTGVYDVNLVLRLVRVFVSSEEGGDAPSQRMKKVGRLIDKYLAEISPDQGLKVQKFLGLAESLPDGAREWYDGVYRALDIYLESHPNLSTEERTSLCRCLNYEKLTLEGCKELAKNRRIPPGVAVQALASQQAKLQIKTHTSPRNRPDPSETPRLTYQSRHEPTTPDEFVDEKEELRLNLYKMQNRVMELEKVCREMKGQMSKMVKSKSFNYKSCNHSSSSRGMPRLC